MLSEAEIALLRRIGEQSPLFTEYTPEAEWEMAAGLRQKGMVKGEGLLTGTARFTITEAGERALADRLQDRR